MAIKKRSKTSNIKRSNQLRTRLTKQGKLKKRRHGKPVNKTYKTPPRPVSDDVASEDSEQEDDIQDMIEEDDLEFLRTAVKDQSYGILKDIHVNQISGSKRKRKSKDNLDETGNVEDEYEISTAETQRKNQKYLLPIKTAEGVVHRVQEEESEDDFVPDAPGTSSSKKKKLSEDILPDMKEVSTVELLAARKDALENKKFRIGILCSGLLEQPELKVANFKPLLEMMDAKESELKISVRKIVLVSLMEVFKDLLPGYQIKRHDDPNVKLKKEVKALHDYENALLKAYKVFLQKLEKIVSILKKKKGDTRVFEQPELQLAVCSLQAMCDLLVTHPYFNFAKNITHLLVPFLNSSRSDVRELVSNSIKEVFKMDKRGEASLEIVRSINKFVRSKSFNVQPDVLTVFLHLKLKGVDLDQEKEAEMKMKKLQAKKGNILRLSKRERKRGKRLEHIEKELLETKAEENVKVKQQHMTDMTKLVFTIYFKILKEAPSSRLLSAALEGLAKFAHCINVDFYHDLINVLDQLIEKEGLGYRQQLCCVQTVFTILSHQGSAINIDPQRFYTYLYANLFNVHAGRNHCDLPIILKATEAVLIRRRKHLSVQRLLAFTKRLCALSLHVLPNGSLGLLALIRQVVQGSRGADALLDNDSSSAQGVYFPEMNEPEYCNASATALWELLPLQRHYHPAVVEYSHAVARMNVQEMRLNGFMKSSAEQLYKDFDFSEVKFNPAVPAPSKSSKHGSYKRMVAPELQAYVRSMLGSQAT